MKRATKSLDHEGRLIPGLLVSRREWPGLWTLWLWLRQGRPMDYPVITREGTITAEAHAVDENGVPEIEAGDVHINGWSFSHSMLPDGVLDTKVLMCGLLDRRLATVTFPDGHEEKWRLKYRPEDPIW